MKLNKILPLAVVLFIIFLALAAYYRYSEKDERRFRLMAVLMFLILILASPIFINFTKEIFATLKW